MQQLLEFEDEALYEIPRGVPAHFWYRRPRIEGYHADSWELAPTSPTGTVTIRTSRPVAPFRQVFVPRIGRVRIAQLMDSQNTVVIEHRLSISPPRSIYAAYYPIGVGRSMLSIRRCTPPNPECLEAGSFIGFTPGGSPGRLYVRFADRAAIGRHEFRPGYPGFQP